MGSSWEKRTTQVCCFSHSTRIVARTLIFWSGGQSLIRRRAVDQSCSSA
ncbi:MAG: hypothetical protein ACFCA4_14700 [Cyanophyceae cyanobacterium]